LSVRLSSFVAAVKTVLTPPTLGVHSMMNEEMRSENERKQREMHNDTQT
jgi:hypothetical protein